MKLNTWCPTENDIIESTVIKLENVGFNILSTCNTKEHGTDIVAEKNGFKLLIEAKGATSSMDGSKRSGKPFTRNQAHTHISAAIYKIMSLMSDTEGDNRILFGICLPYEKNHREFIERIQYSLDFLNIIILWISEGDVVIEIRSKETKNLFR